MPLSLKNFFWLSVAIILIILLHYSQVLSPLESGFLKFWLPLQRAFYQSGQYFLAGPKFWQEARQWQEQNENLKKQVNELQAELAELPLLKQENETLRKELNYLQTNPLKYLAAKVVGKTTDLNSNILLLDQGAKAGVKVGQPVVSAEGIMVGKIVKVKEQFAHLLLITANQSKITARLQNKLGGLVVGDFNLGLKLTNIPQDLSVKPGDLVVTAGLEPEIPAGLLLGIVDKVYQRPNDFFQSASLKSLLAFEELNFVLILTSF